MFILIPAIIIFLLLSYLYLNDVGIVEEIVVYVLIVLVVIIAFKLYYKIKRDLKQQEINSIQMEINELVYRLNNLQDDKQKDFIQNKIELLKKEIKTKTNT